MGTAAKISIDLDANTAALKEGFGEATKAVKNLGDGMSGHVALGMAKFHAGLAAVQAALGAARGAINEVTAAMGSLDAEQKLADRIGVTADQLTVLNLAAEHTGASAEAMNKALIGIARKSSEAAKGTGDAVAAFQELGLSAETMASLSPDQQFGAIADAMQNVGSQSDKVRLAVKLFGDEGTALLNTIAGGSAGLNEFGKEAESLGLLLGDSRRSVEAANDAITKMKRAWGALVSQVAIAVAPALTTIADALSRIVGFFARLTGIATGATGKMADFGKASKAAADAFRPGADPAKVAAEKTATDAAKKASEELASRGKAITEGLREPAEIYRDTMRELSAMATAGAINMETFRRGAARAMETYKKTTETGAAAATPGAAAITRSDMAAYSAIQAAQRGRDDERRRHTETIASLAAIERAVRDAGITLAPMRI